MPGAEVPLNEVKTDAAGFRAAGLAEAGLRIEVWGYWTPDVALAFSRDAPDIVVNLGMTGTLVLEATDLKPQSTAGQDAMRVLFRALTTRSFLKATLKTSNVLTRMQLTRLVRECGLDGRVAFE